MNLDFLKQQNVSESLIKDVDNFRKQFPLDENMKRRVPNPPIPFYGKEILEMSIAALLKGENLLLSGGKATGKNILAENLAYIFGRPSYNISFHVNVDSAALVGTDTFIDNEVRLRKGMVTLCAENGGLGVFDEINMAKNDAVSVLHAALDYRGIIDIPGYDRIELHPATRFIGTMNYGYAGTKELNEALVSRFMVINMPKQDEETVKLILKTYFPEAKEKALDQFTGLFMDLQLKAEHSEISTKSVDIRGMIGALKTIQTGLKPTSAVNMGITNKSFDIFEREIVEDIVMTRIPEDWTRDDVF
ncbi:MAG: MoxR family ATPase [Lachnospiraceae bacterium]|nr:MoxR family ATPase [Lachnospiraceae bacterium]MEE1015437.1 MoxR family ATPase [Lachnospiraceae bacterium]